MNDLLNFAPLTAILLSYLLGSICFGILISGRRGVNLREQGSGNIGSTNVLRVIGKREAFWTLLGDVLKGTLAVQAARILAVQEPWLACSAGAAILGHNYPVYYKFKGGKGVATTFGVLFGYLPWAGLLLLLAWGASFWVTRTSSVGALTVSVMLPFIAYWLGRDPVHVWFGLFAGAMMLFRHKDNLRRLIRGEEKPC